MATTNAWNVGDARTTWALCWQAAVGRDFLATPALAAKIRERLIGAHQKHSRELIDFVMLQREIHAITQLTPGDSVGLVARGFGNVVSRWVRLVQPIRGPVLAGRFWAQPLESEEALRAEVRMLAWRPVVRRASVTPTYHPHGGLRVALGLTTSNGFDARPLLRHFGGPVPEARSALRQWISRRPSERDWRTWELTRGLELATSNGGEQVRAAKTASRDAAMLIALAGGQGVEGALDLLHAWVTVRMQAPAMRGAKIRPSSMQPRVRGVVACLAVAHRLCPASTVARHFGRSKATLSEQMAACRSRPADRTLVATPLRRILDECVLLSTGVASRRTAAAARSRRPRDL
ncbi:hypothetical protein [Roseateles chitinivorans]|uniref:hypothetical protein n=1 Tax=Roseateles chitinivorans TaxID=2917965 RepID=UPI003D66627F